MSKELVLILLEVTGDSSGINQSLVSSKSSFPPLIKEGLELIGFTSWIVIPARGKD